MGYQANTTTGDCEACPVGYYKDSIGSATTTCSPCPLELPMTLSTGSTSQSDCIGAPGWSRAQGSLSTGFRVQAATPGLKLGRPEGWGCSAAVPCCVGCCKAFAKCLTTVGRGSHGVCMQVGAKNEQAPSTAVHWLGTTYFVQASRSVLDVVAALDLRVDLVGCSHGPEHWSAFAQHQH